MSIAASSSRPGASPHPGGRPNHAPSGPNTQTKVLDTVSGRILCIADIRGRLSHLNTLAREHNVNAIVHTGDFGFYETNSLERINDRTLKHLLMYSPLISNEQRNSLLSADTPPAAQKQHLHSTNLSTLTEFPQLLSGSITLDVPVYTVWGACEDVSVLEKFRMGVYEVPNLHVLDEATTRCIDVGGVKLRLLGLGGALVQHKLFDNGDGQATIAGGGGTMWTTALQVGELVDTAQRVYDSTETRLLVTHASPGREGLMGQLALVTRADLTISGGLHFRYASSYNEFSVQGDAEGFRSKLLRGKESVDRIWESVKGQVESSVDEQQRILLEKFLSVLSRVPPPPQGATNPITAQNTTNNATPNQTGEEPSWKNCWNWNLCDAAYGCLILDIKEGRVSADLKSQGFNYAYRRSGQATAPADARSVTPQQQQPQQQQQPNAAASVIPPATSVHRQTNSTHTDQTPKTPVSEMSSPITPAPNGLADGSHSSKEKQERYEAKKKEKREKDKERREKIKAEKERDTSKANGTGSGKATPAPAPTTAPTSPGPEAQLTSPLQASSTSAPRSVVSPDPSGSASGAQTPVSTQAGSNTLNNPNNNSGRPNPPKQRNPYTLLLKLPQASTEPEIRSFFTSPSREAITKITLPAAYFGKPRISFVEFGNEEDMKTALASSGHAEKIGDGVVGVTIAEDRSDRHHHQNFNDHHGHRGGSYRGRGGPRGGGFAQRGLAAAGLTQNRERKASTGGGSGEKKEGGGD